MRIGDLVQRIAVRGHYNEDGEEVPALIDALHTGTVIGTEYDHETSLTGVTVRWDDGRVVEYDNKEHEDDRDGLYDLEVVTPLLYVNVYLWDRCYGGPEEGGWYYDRYDPVPEESVLAPSVEEAQRLLEAKKAWAEEQNQERRHPSSVRSEGHYVVCLEAWPGEPTPPGRPHYC